MREIKFRGISLIDHTPDDMPYCIFKGDMVTGLLAKAGENAWIIGNVVEATEEYIAIESWIPVDPETVGQYTGLRDKDGKEIYEGDILDAEDRIVKVVWHEQAGCWDCDFIRYVRTRKSKGIPNTQWENCAKIIGNIHENPKLLEVMG